MGEIVEDGKTGFLVSSVEEMAARIRDIGRIDRRSCRSRAELLFDSKLMAANYVDLYRSLLGLTSQQDTGLFSDTHSERGMGPRKGSERHEVPARNLKGAKKKTLINANDALKVVLDGQKRMTMFRTRRHLSRHPR